MGEPIYVPVDNGLWAGMNNEQVKGDDLYNQINFRLKKRGLGQQNIKYISTANYPMPLDTALQNTALVNSTATNPLAAFDLQSFFANNKWLVIGGLGLIGYLVFVKGGGSALAEKSVVTRYAPVRK